MTTELSDIPFDAASDVGSIQGMSKTQDTLKRDDMQNTPRAYSPATSKALTRAAKRGTANLTPEQVSEIGRDWVVVGTVQVCVNAATLRAFRL